MAKESLETKQLLTIRDIAEVTGWTYEQARKRVMDGFFHSPQYIKGRWYVDREQIIELTKKLGKRNA